MGRRKTIQVKCSTSAMMAPAASERLAKAASAVGLTQAQLVDLVRDSGALSLPPDESDGITYPVTLRELGEQMRAQLGPIPPDDRPAWFAGLLEPQRIGLVVHCNDLRFRPEVIASDLGISSLEVRRLLNQYADKVGMQVTQIRLSTIAGQVQIVAERAMEGLLAKEDFKGYFSVQKEMVAILQSLGIVDQAIHRVEVTHKLGDNTQAEIEAMLEIERKKARRLEEIKSVEHNVLESVPQLSFEKES